MLQKLQGHWGFTRLPFGRDLAPSMLHRHAAHNEAVARITWTVTERALSVITGEVGVGKPWRSTRTSSTTSTARLSSWRTWTHPTGWTRSPRTCRSRRRDEHEQARDSSPA